MEEKKNILPQSELEDSVLEGAVGGNCGYTIRCRVSCDCMRETMPDDEAKEYEGKTCPTCGKKYFVDRL